jgi:hypothetical protein
MVELPVVLVRRRLTTPWACCHDRRAAAPLAPDLVAGLRRLKLAAIRRLAPKLLITAKTQRWGPPRNCCAPWSRLRSPPGLRSPSPGQRYRDSGLSYFRYEYEARVEAERFAEEDFRSSKNYREDNGRPLTM